MRPFCGKLLSLTPLSGVLRPLTSGAATIFMLHRFRDGGREGEGCSAPVLAEHLEWLRNQGYHIVPVAELVADLAAGVKPRAGTIAFTVDDGYRDFAEIGAGIFSRYDCPVTVFLVSGLIDNGGWFWWDRVKYLLKRSARRELTLELGGTWVRCRWADVTEQARVWESVCGALKRVPEERRVAALEVLPRLLDVELPSHPPQEFAPMTWDQVTACAAGGATFGPHTVTHPILARTSDEQAAFEIQASWDRVRSQTDAAVPIFCYPQGDPASFGPRECDLARRAGLAGALSTAPGYATRAGFSRPEGAYAVPRHAHPDDRFGFLQIVTGVERMKALLRGSWLSS